MAEAVSPVVTGLPVPTDRRNDMDEFTSAYEWRGRTVLDRDGDKVGKVEAVFLEHGSDDPAWALVHTGRFGKKLTFVPVAGARPHREDVSVAASKEEIENAPKIEADQELTPEEENELYRHYGLETDNRRLRRQETS